MGIAKDLLEKLDKYIPTYHGFKLGQVVRYKTPKGEHGIGVVGGPGSQNDHVKVHYIQNASGPAPSTIRKEMKGIGMEATEKDIKHFSRQRHNKGVLFGPIDIHKDHIRKVG